MSSSLGNPSNKDKWFKSLCAKFKHQERLKNLATKVAEGGKIDLQLPEDKGGVDKDKRIGTFANYLEQAKLEKSKRQERDRKRKVNNNPGESK
jgi:hypothetical protein